MVPQPHQSKIRDFCQLPQRGSHGRSRASTIDFNLPNAKSLCSETGKQKKSNPASILNCPDGRHFPPHSTAVNREIRQSCKRLFILYESFPGLSTKSCAIRRNFQLLSISTWRRGKSCQKLAFCRLDANFTPCYNFLELNTTLMTDGFVEHHMGVRALVLFCRPSGLTFPDLGEVRPFLLQSGG